MALKKLLFPLRNTFSLLLHKPFSKVQNHCNPLFSNCHTPGLFTNILYFTTVAQNQPQFLSPSQQISEEELVEYINSTSQVLLEDAKILPDYLKPVQTWVTNISTGKKLNCILLLDRKVFGTPPRIDLVDEVVRWQRAGMRQGTLS